MAGRQSRRERWKAALAERWPLLLALAVGLVLRLVRIDARELWLDEACTSLFAQANGPAALVDQLVPESHPPLYYFLTQLWVGVFGAGEVAVRLPSTLAGLALVALVWRLVRAFGGGRFPAALAALAAAASPLMIYYSVEAKSYTLLWALFVGSVLLLRSAADPGGRASFRTASVVTVAALYTHHFALLLAPIWLLAIAAAPREARRGGVFSAAMAVVAYLPWALGYLTGQTLAGGTDWLAGFWQGIPAALAGSVQVMSLTPPFPAYLGELAQVELPAGLALTHGLWFGVPVAAGAALILLRPRDHGGRPGTRLRSSLLLAALVIPVAVPLLVSLVQPMYLVGRYELLAYPAWLALWALGLDWGLRRLSGRSLRHIAATAVVAVTMAGLTGTGGAYAFAPDPPWHHHEAAARMTGALLDEAFVAVGLTRAPLEHQLRQLHDPHTLVSFPPEVAQHPGWMRHEKYSAEKLTAAATRTVEGLAARPGIWVVVELSGQGELPRLALPLFQALRAAGRDPGPPLVFGRLGVVRFGKTSEQKARGD